MGCLRVGRKYLVTDYAAYSAAAFGWLISAAMLFFILVLDYRPEKGEWLGGFNVRLVFKGYQVLLQPGQGNLFPIRGRMGYYTTLPGPANNYYLKN